MFRDKACRTVFLFAQLGILPLGGTEIRALRRLQRESEPSRYVFCIERGGPMTRTGFRRMIERTGDAAKFAFPIHPHMLRHSTGFKLANDGVDTRALQHYLGPQRLRVPGIV